MAIATVTRQLYRPLQTLQNNEFAAPIVQPCIWGKEQATRTERLTYTYGSDHYEGLSIRSSFDNGKTFTPFTQIEDKLPTQKNNNKAVHWVANCYNYHAKHDIRFDLQRIFIGDVAEALGKSWQGEESFFDHGFYCTSTDNGQSFSEPKLLKFEPGDDFDNNNWANNEFLKNNTMYGGYTAIITKSGKLLYPFTTETDICHDGKQQRTSVARCMIGTWSPEINDYSWQISNTIAVPLQISGRGFMEPAITQLQDGRIVMSLRGSTDLYKAYCPDGSITVESPGRHWISISDDDGQTFSQPTDFRYHTGEQFYSPSTFGKFLRYSNGNLYWIGNITPEPPKGNMPRYPLVIAQVDETIPAIIKDSVTTIETKPTDQPTHELFQISNFACFENPETNDIELYLTLYGEAPEHWLKANAYKYTISLNK